MLQAQDHVGEKTTHEAENQERESVLFPALLLFRINAENPVSQFFQRAHDRVKPRAAIRIEHAAQVNAERFGDERERAEVNHEFQPLMGVHKFSGVKIFQAAPLQKSDKRKARRK